MSGSAADDLLDALKDHHARIEQMMASITSASGHDRTVAFRRLRRFLAAHEAAEEVFVHAGAARVLEDPEVAGQRLAEEVAAGSTIATLEDIDVDSAEFDRIFGELSTSVSKHAQAEEHRELPEVIEACGPGDVQRMRRALEHVDLVVARRHGPLGAEDQSFATMVDAARAEFRVLRSELNA